MNLVSLSPTTTGLQTQAILFQCSPTYRILYLVLAGHGPEVLQLTIKSGTDALERELKKLSEKEPNRGQFYLLSPAIVKKFNGDLLKDRTKRQELMLISGLHTCTVLKCMWYI